MLMQSLTDLGTGLRFLAGIPSYLRSSLSPQEARSILQLRLQRREADFLSLARRAIGENPHSPYRHLLQVAGCEYGDLQTLIAREGLEGALQVLFRHGVYLSVDEFKGRRPAVRGSASVGVDPASLRNPSLGGHVTVRSGGSQGAGTPVPLDLPSNRDRAVNKCLALDSRGAREWVHAVWGVPGTTAMNKLLDYTLMGARPVRWFSSVDPSARGVAPTYRWADRLLRWGSMLAGTPLPALQYVGIEDPLPIGRWMREVLDRGGTPHLFTFASPAVRLCQAALADGIDLHGAQLTVSGEPLTAARIAAIRAVGAQAVPSYSSSESGTLAKGCLDPLVADDLHFFHDLHALVQPGEEASAHGLPPRALLLTSLRATAKFMFLNVATGDEAVVAQRTCGCPMEALGWRTHVHTVRSYEKLTAGGMAFLDRDVVRVLEELLPARFGGGPTHYQLQEEEGDDAGPRLRLVVHPSVGRIEETAVQEAFLAALGTLSPTARIMELAWREAGCLRVERGAPLPTPSGKILHLHTRRAGTDA